MKSPDSEFDLGLADAVTIYSICLAGGATHRESLNWASNRITNPLFEDFALLAQTIEAGHSVEAACQIASAQTHHPRFREFATKVGLASQLGSALNQQLRDFTKTLRAEYLIELRTLGVRAETRMLLPQVLLTLPLTILFSLFPSIQMLSGGYL